MKIIKKLYFKHKNDLSKDHIFDISDKRIKEINKLIKENNNVFFEIEGKFYKIFSNKEYISCEECDIRKKCHEYSASYSCLASNLAKNQNFSNIFKEVDEYEIIFSGDYNEKDI